MANQCATVVRFQEGAWQRAWVVTPDVDDYVVLKNTVLVQMNDTKDRCFQCPEKAEAIAMTSLRVIHGTEVERIFVIVDHCAACGLAAAAKSSSYRKTEIESPGTFYYRCAKCRKMETKMSKCGRCHITPYCSEACQRADYKSHLVYCPVVVKK